MALPLASLDDQQRAQAEALASRDPNTLDELERAVLEGYYRAGIIGATAAGIISAVRSVSDVATRLLNRAERRRGERLKNPKMLQADIKTRDQKIAVPDHWLEDVIADFERHRAVGMDVSPAYFERVMRQVHKLASDGRGYFQRGYKAIGRGARLGRSVTTDWGRETVRKSMDWAREMGWIGPMNALDRDENRALKRQANVYQLFSKSDAAEIAATKPEERDAKRWDLTVTRGAALFGLIVTPWGLNRSVDTTRSRSVRRATREANRNRVSGTRTAPA